jgi:ATP-dependent helicase/nuclease subunit A
MSKLASATPDQRKASNPQGSAWVGANAGSGKTHVLVDRVIRIMLEGVDPTTILCITYTKAAAAEMAARVHERLGKWVGIPDAELTERLEIMGCEDITPVILARARRLFTAALETPGGFKIQTIHAFCERILHLFPIEAGMAPGFVVLDERQAFEFLTASRDKILSEAQRDDESVLARAFSLISRHAQADSFDNLLEGMLKRRRDLQDLLGQLGSLANIESALKQLLEIGAEENAGTLCGRLLEFDREMAKRAIPLLSVSLKTNQKTAELYEKLLVESDSVEAEKMCRSHFFSGDGDTPRSFSSVVTDKFVLANPWVGDWLTHEFDRVSDLIMQIDNLKRVKATLALLTLSFAIIAHFDATKQMHGAYDFEDLILRTRDLLTDRRAAQWVLYKLDRGFEHVLVDEAQDTSLAQWQIIDALTEEFFSGSGARETPIRTLFVVGDRKQSIYSFQGADPAAFESSRSKFRKQIRDVKQPFYDVDLTISYRTTAEVLKTVDTVFAEGNPARIGLDGDVETILHHETNRSGESGLFELWPLIQPVEKDDPEPWQAPVDLESATSPQRVLARKIAVEVKSWIGERHIAALNRAVQPGDILILFRTRNTLFAAMISELRKLGVAVAGADRLKLSKNIAILDMMALIRFVLLPSDDHSLACILKSPLVPTAFSEEQLFDLAHGRGKTPLWTRLAQSTHFAAVAAYETLAGWMELAEQARPYEFLSTVLLKARKSILARLGGEAGDALDGLLESSLAYEEQHSTSLSGFASWFLANDAEIKRDMESGHGEVRLMTVHGAKGLESSIVILPDTTGLPSDQKSSGLMFVESEEGRPMLPLWRLSKLTESEKLRNWKSEKTDSGLEEYRRQLYVAMTRARDELYFCGYQGGRKLAETSWYHMVKEALLNPKEGKSLLWPVAGSDGADIWRYGPDPVWGAATLATTGPQRELPDWLIRQPTHPDTVQGHWTPTRLTNAGKSVKSFSGVSRGRVIHKILQEIPGLAEYDALKEARRLLEKSHLDTALAEEIVDLISKPETLDFFALTSQAEVSLGAILPDGQRFAGRVDRLVIRPNDIWVLDYKTDWNVPEALSHTHPYVTQMAAYAVALRQAYPNKPVKTALLWTNARRLDWISDEMLGEAISGIAGIT